MAAGGGPGRRFIPASAGNARVASVAASTTAVHPRERGERSPFIERPRRSSGSSPRARGTLRIMRPRRLIRRFIPASAGNACAPARGRCGRAVHPRERGERGRLDADRQAGHRARFIPASAGNAKCHEFRLGYWSVHPRERGERSDYSRLEKASGGSSPRARGTRRSHGHGREVRRFIPASAGNAEQYVLSVSFPSAHPRERGERSPSACAPSSAARFIPASAGNAPSASYRGRAVSVHPRERGERATPCCCCVPCSGSSPRARGTRRLARHRRAPGRFIPASAGNASGCSRSSPLTAVHPRERGERFLRRLDRAALSGSSPRARGTLELEQRNQAACRFIPASAGNAPSSGARTSRSSVHPRERGERGGHLKTPPAGSRFIPASAGNAWPACP